MIKYIELVQYIKKEHINWNTDLFDVLKGFFNQYYPPPQHPTHSSEESSNIIEASTEPFIEPEGGEYSAQDLLNLFLT